MLKQCKNLSPYLRTCDSLQLSPDFMIPQDMGDKKMTIEIPNSTIVDSDQYEPILASSSSTGSSGSENIMSHLAYMTRNNIVRKKRSGLYLCARSANINRISDHEDMGTSMSSRRKGVPHRSPLC